MKNSILLASLVLMIMLSGCQLAGDIFKAGFWSAIIMIAVVVGLILYFFSRMRGR